MKKVIIIGAGVAGLTCGIYLQTNGFDTEIYEMHAISGGECTGWDRKGYHFDGCIHWLVGSKRGTDLFGMWQDTGALDDSVQIIDHEIYGRYVEGDIAVNFHANADKLEKHLLELAPEDKKEIRSLCSAIRRLGGFGMPLQKPMDMMTASDGLKFALGSAGTLGKIMRYNKLTMKELADTFKNPVLKRALLTTFPEHFTAMALVSTLAGMHAGDCGYPRGGSRAFAGRMEKKFTSLGGKVFNNSRCESILVEDGRAVGIRLTDGREIRADHIVSCADGYHTLTNLLDDKYTPELYSNLFSHPAEFPAPTCALVFLGIDTDIPYQYRLLETQRELAPGTAGLADNSIAVLNYGYDDTLAPAGKSILGCFYYADYDYWQSLRADPEKYMAEKKRLEAQAVADAMRFYPEIEGHIEVTDVVTPMTYVRYCNAWRGSWMSWMSKGREVPQYFPGILPGLEKFIMAGMWTMPPGGLPGSAAAGRFAAQRLCIQNGIDFKTA